MCPVCFSVGVAAVHCLFHVVPPTTICAMTPLRGARLGSRGRSSRKADRRQPLFSFSRGGEGYEIYVH